MVTPKHVAIALLTLLANISLAQQPVDLFSDSPALAEGFVRIGAWNVRHLDLSNNSDRYFAGRDREEDFSILIGSFAKAVLDLKLDLVVLVEVQPRTGEPDRLQQLLQSVRACSGGEWQSHITCLEYDEPDDPYGNLQFGLLWNEARGVRIDRSKTRLLEELRQPRSPQAGLLRKDQRAPWLIPVAIQASTSISLQFDLLALHLKSGGATPQAAEVEAITRFIQEHQSPDSPRHLIVCGDWNIRPDEDEQGRGRSRLRKMTIPIGGDSLLKLLTVGEAGPSLEEWEQLSERVVEISRIPALSGVLPYSHVDTRDGVMDTLLDHMAISRTLDELFDHPLEVRLASGKQDLRPGIEIVKPLIPHDDYVHFTDHLPVVLTLRVDQVKSERRPSRVRIVATEPNPISSEAELESVMLSNRSKTTIDLLGWRIQDSVGGSWTIDEADLSSVGNRWLRGRTLTIRRRRREMTLSNSGDTISLFDRQNNLVDTQKFGPAKSGQMIWFD
jgi:endonuclease/exonuclease/phosphatase family metal-dependent hydrolase